LALRQAGALAQGATLYVTLEPCAHTGRTPPCTEAILAAGIRRLVAATIDPNPRNNGRGLRWLRAHGIRTEVGVLEEEARRLNEQFFTRMTRRRPFVTVKVAQSLDGKIATRSGDSRWISGPTARAWVHRLRAKVDAILLGVETVLKDDPRLTVRAGQGTPDPLRVILDSQLRIPPTARLFSSRAPVLIATTRSASRAKERRLRRAGADVLRLPAPVRPWISPVAGGRHDRPIGAGGPAREGQVDLKGLLRQLAKREISHLLIEGGGEVIASAFAAQAVDRVAWIIAPKILGGRDAPTSVDGIGISRLRQAIPIQNIRFHRLGSDLLVEGDVQFRRN